MPHFLHCTSDVSVLPPRRRRKCGRVSHHTKIATVANKRIFSIGAIVLNFSPIVSPVLNRAASAQNGIFFVNHRARQMCFIILIMQKTVARSRDGVEVETAADFGFADVAVETKTALVGDVFSRVAPYYDRMNDVMSGGLHRCWKDVAVLLGDLRAGMSVLDLACGSGDLSARIAPKIMPGGQLTMADINGDMLRAAHCPRARAVQCNGESLPFATGSFERVFIGFGLRNIARRRRALAEMRRVLRPGGMCVILEFSPPEGMLAAAKRHYLISLLPLLGGIFFNDAKSYRYLGESIVRFPNRHQISAMLSDVGFLRAECFNLAAGVVLLHRARRLS